MAFSEASVLTLTPLQFLPVTHIIKLLPTESLNN